ncbi:DUF1382 family protein [Pseudomonas capsici]|uniref:DUF1382 family protein n=1 Tax=Pseudomonas capsici TaxID=2810614 RepID=UPI0021F121E1|nr:DUF1382 family protein [Pseudomonas capsici]MCV4343295.1 DUF1382 family protein [Pseudomonas capsici]
MNRANSPALRQALSMAQAYAKAGIDYVCVPVLSESDKIDLVNKAAGRFEQLIQQSEKVEAAQ